MCTHSKTQLSFKSAKCQVYKCVLEVHTFSWNFTIVVKTNIYYILKFDKIQRFKRVGWPTQLSFRFFFKSLVRYYIFSEKVIQSILALYSSSSQRLILSENDQENVQDHQALPMVVLIFRPLESRNFLRLQKSPKPCVAVGTSTIQDPKYLM